MQGGGGGGVGVLSAGAGGGNEAGALSGRGRLGPGATEAVVSMGGFGLGFGGRATTPGFAEAGVCTPRGLGVESLIVLVFWVPSSSR